MQRELVSGFVCIFSAPQICFFFKYVNLGWLTGTHVKCTVHVHLITMGNEIRTTRILYVILLYTNYVILYILTDDAFKS